MKITFERSGGFANIRLAGDFNSDTLPPDQAAGLHALLNQAHFSALPERINTHPLMPDQFSYTISVDTGAGPHTVVTGENSAPESLRPLLEKLTELARAQRK